MNLIYLYFLFLIIIVCYAGPIEDISAMPDLSLFYQQLIRQQDLQGLLQDIYPSQQPSTIGDFTIFAPNNDAMTRINRRNEDPNLLWKYHIVPGRYDDQTIFNMAQEKFNQIHPSQINNVRPQNNLPTMALPFQVFYGVGFYGGIGPYINVNPDNTGYNSAGIPWLPRTPNTTKTFDNVAPLNPYLVNMNNYNPNQPTQTYVVAQGSLSSSNPNLFPQNLTNYYTNVFNPNVNTQFLQNINPPPANFNPNIQQQPGFMPVGSGGMGIQRPTINNAFILQSRLMSRGIINVIDNILWPPERRDQIQYKTAYDALEDSQFSRLRLLADRSDYFRSELRSPHHQTWFLPNDQAFANLGANAQFLFEQSIINNTNDVNDFIKSHIIPIVLYPTVMDASKQFSTLIRGKWVTFRKIIQTDQTFQVDVISNRQVARILASRTEDIRIYGNGVVYPISTFLSGIARSAADELARSYQYFMALIQQSGDTELVNLLQGNTAGLGNTGPNMLNPQNLLTITVLIPQQIAVKQLGNSQDLSMNLRRHIIRFPVYTDQLTTMSNPFVQQQQPFIQPGFLPPQFQRSPSSSSNKKLPQRHRRRRRQVNMPTNINFQQQQQIRPSQSMSPTQQQIFPMQQQQNLPIQQQMVPAQQQQIYPIQQQQQNLPIQQQQQQPTFSRQQQQQNLPIQQQQTFPGQQQQQPNLPIQQQQMLPTQQQQGYPMQQQQQNLPRQQQMLPSQQQQSYPMQQQQQNLPRQQQQMLPSQQQQILPSQQQQMLPSQQQQMLPSQQQQILPSQQQQSYPMQQQQQNLPRQQQQMLPSQQQQMSPTQQLLPTQKQQQQQQQVSSKQQMLPDPQMFPNQPFLPNPEQQMLPSQPFFPTQQQQMLPNQPLLPTQQQQMLPNQPLLPTQQQQMMPTQQFLPNQQQFDPNLNPSFNPMPIYPTSAIFQDGQIYPTMDPQFSIQAQISSGPNGNVVTLIGRPENSLPFAATVLNTESNIPIKNGVMHVIRGILSGTAIPLDTVLSTMQGASSFTQLLQQTGVIDQLKQSGRPYTLFIPTNTALQSIGVSTNTNQIRQFVLRHVCADVLLDPMANILRRSGGYYSRSQMPRAQQQQRQQQQQQQQRRTRRKRQDWADVWRNGTMTIGGPPVKAPDLGPGYFQPQEQVFGGYPAAPSPFGSYNQLYNPSYVMTGYANPNSEYYPFSNGSNTGANGFHYDNFGVPIGKPMSDATWNSTFGAFYNPQLNVVPMTGSSGIDPSYYTGTGGFYSGSTYAAGPQSCTAMTGERITVQPLPGNQLAGKTPINKTGGNEAMNYQNFMVTCCSDQSVNAMVQSFNIYPPSFAVYLIGRSLLSYGQTINNMFNHANIIVPYQSTVFILFTLLIIIKYL
ncbi:unnamed protein product [Rotaria sp. Silwood1]|nr:unnamed protein product [Rotaria sp. Silwood1]